MSLKIEATPILEGKDADNFLAKMSKSESHTPTQKGMENALEGAKFYKEITESNPNIFGNV